MTEKRNQRLIRACGFISQAHSSCLEAMKSLGKELSAEDHANLLAILFAVETHTKMARELVTDSMKQVLLDEARDD